MSLFKNILGAIFGHAAPAASTGNVAGSPLPAGAAPSTASATATPSQPVDIEPILDDLAAKNSEDLDWKKSIVDLLKLLGIDSSLSARKELAKELNYTGDTGDSATMNQWLHKEVLKKISENGGKVPASLLD
jgi:hypothetical protein